MHKKYKEDIKHVDLDGVSVQRILKNHCQGNEKYPVPLVFSPSFEIPMLSEVFLNEIGDLSYIISQTPGVWLDAQVYQLKQFLFDTMKGDHISCMNSPYIEENVKKILDL